LTIHISKQVSSIN